MKYSTSLKLNHIFRRLYRTSGVADGLLVLYARKNRTDGNRVGITVSKKLGKAHVMQSATFDRILLVPGPKAQEGEPTDGNE